VGARSPWGWPNWAAPTRWIPTLGRERLPRGSPGAPGEETQGGSLGEFLPFGDPRKEGAEPRGKPQGGRPKEGPSKLGGPRGPVFWARAPRGPWGTLLGDGGKKGGGTHGGPKRGPTIFETPPFGFPQQGVGLRETPQEGGTKGGNLVAKWVARPGAQGNPYLFPQNPPFSPEGDTPNRGGERTQYLFPPVGPPGAPKRGDFSLSQGKGSAKRYMERGENPGGPGKKGTPGGPAHVGDINPWVGEKIGAPPGRTKGDSSAREERRGPHRRKQSLWGPHRVWRAPISIMWGPTKRGGGGL